MKTSSESLSCGICYSKKNVHFFRAEKPYTLYRCSECDLVFLKERERAPQTFLQDAEAKDKTEYWGFPQYFQKYSTIFDFYFEERFQRIKAAVPPEGEWLDIGSGYGLWQSFLKTKSVQCTGIEIEKNAFQFSSNAGHDVSLISIEEFQTDKKFAVITMCDVLEHVEDPAMILRKCKSLLKEGGLLYIQVPNVLGFKIPYGDHLGLPHHLWQFNPKSLGKLSKNSGFKIVDYWTGVQGVIKYHERGSFLLFHKLAWKLAMKMKRGNRLQLLLKN